MFLLVHCIQAKVSANALSKITMLLALQVLKPTSHLICNYAPTAELWGYSAC